MKKTVLMDEQVLIDKAAALLFEHLGPVEATRFFSLNVNKRLDSVARHRKWQKQLDQKTDLE